MFSIISSLTRHVGEVHHHVGVLSVREVDGPPGVHQRLEVRVAVGDDGGALPRHHAHVTHQLRVKLHLNSGSEKCFRLQKLILFFKSGDSNSELTSHCG